MRPVEPMIALLIIATWIVLAWLVLALCRAARLGDLQRRSPELEPAANEPLAAPVSRSAAPRAGRTAHGGSSFARAGGAAG